MMKRQASTSAEQAGPLDSSFNNKWASLNDLNLDTRLPWQLTEQSALIRVRALEQLHPLLDKLRGVCDKASRSSGIPAASPVSKIIGSISDSEQKLYNLIKVPIRPADQKIDLLERVPNSLLATLKNFSNALSAVEHAALLQTGTPTVKKAGKSDALQNLSKALSPTIKALTAYELTSASQELFKIVANPHDLGLLTPLRGKLVTWSNGYFKGEYSTTFVAPINRFADELLQSDDRTVNGSEFYHYFRRNMSSLLDFGAYVDSGVVKAVRRIQESSTIIGKHNLAVDDCDKYCTVKARFQEDSGHKVYKTPFSESPNGNSTIGE